MEQPQPEDAGGPLLPHQVAGPIDIANDPGVSIDALGLPIAKSQRLRDDSLNTVSLLRSACDERILGISGIGVATLDAIRVAIAEFDED